MIISDRIETFKIVISNPKFSQKDILFNHKLTLKKLENPCLKVFVGQFGGREIEFWFILKYFDKVLLKLLNF